MARSLTTDQRNLLRSPDLAANILLTFYLDEGIYRFCDYDFDLYDGTNTYIGASAFSEAADIRSGQDLSAQESTLILDGMRMTQYGISDPAKVLREILDYLHQQRRVDYALGLRYMESKDINMVLPLYAGRINHARLVDESVAGYGDSEASTVPKLEIVLDALAARYNKATLRTRSHQDQLELDPTDKFFSFTVDATQNEALVYWGKETPRGVTTSYSTATYNWNSFVSRL